MSQPAPDLREIIDQIKERVPVEAIVGRRVQLHPRGGRLWGLCPFHPEKTPSFTVSPDRGFFKCFGCGKAGDALTFLQEIDGLEFREALRFLADEAGIELPQRSSEPRMDATLREGAREALLQARRHYVEALAAPGGAAARGYLESRGISEASQRAFSIGWAPAESGWLLQRLQRGGLSAKAIEEAGLAFVPEGASGLRDRFWDRLIFPVADVAGRTVGFGGRYLPGSKAEERGMGKYVNSPEGSLFPKRRLLYGIDRLAAGLRERPDSAVIVCEGFLDVVLLHQAGFMTALAALGTALTPDHARRLRRTDRPVVLLLDADPAGRKAAFRGAQILVAEGVDVRIVELPDGQDPADMVASGRREELSQRLAEARDIIDWRFESWTAKEDFGVPAVRAKAASELAEWVATTPNPVLAEVWTRAICDRLGLTEAAFRRLIEPSTGPRRETAPAAGAIPPATEDGTNSSGARACLERNEREIAAAVLLDPSIYPRFRTELEGLDLQCPGPRKVLNWCVERRNEGASFDLAAALEAFGEGPERGWLDEVRLLGPADLNAVLVHALRMLPDNRERVLREERAARSGPASDADLARLLRRVDVSPSHTSDS